MSYYEPLNDFLSILFGDIPTEYSKSSEKSDKTTSETAASQTISRPTLKENSEMKELNAKLEELNTLNKQLINKNKMLEERVRTLTTKCEELETAKKNFFTDNVLLSNRHKRFIDQTEVLGKVLDTVNKDIDVLVHSFQELQHIIKD